MKHCVIPDVQFKPGNDTAFLTRIGTYLVDKQPDIIICIGDFADMPSLSSYDVGKKTFEGRRYKADVEATQQAMEALLAPLRAYNAKQRRTKHQQYNPRLILTLGNHEQRIQRAVENDPKLDGTIGLSDLKYEEYGWEVYPYLQPVVIDGIAYCHYFCTGVMGRPCTSAQVQLNKMHFSVVSGHQQGLQIATGHRADGKRLTSVIAGSCLTPDHKVLTSDLRYVPLGKIKIGDTLVSFDEEVVNKRSRRYKTGVVEALQHRVKDVFEVKLTSGKKFKVTADHRWLVKTGSKYHWKTTDTLRKGTCIPKLFEEWSYNYSREAGWLEGMYDGEGSLSQRKTTGGTTMQLSIAQNEGPILDRLKYALEIWYGNTTTYTATGRKCRQLRLQGGTTKIAKFLGEIRPQRLLSKFKPEFLGRINSADTNNDKVVSITKLGPQEIVEIAIDAKTMIVEGYPHHNCYEHNEDYLGPQGNKHWRGILMLHDVQDGEFDLMPVSLDYLGKKYK